MEKLISKLISKIYKTPKFMIHILKLKMWLILPTVLVCPILIPYFVHLTEETKGHSTLPTNFLQSALKTWKPSIFYPGINFSFQFRSQRLLQMFRVWRKGLFFSATNEQYSRKPAIKSLNRTSQNLTFVFMKVMIWRQLHLFIKLFPCQQKACVNIQLTCYVSETWILAERNMVWKNYLKKHFSSESHIKDY